MLGCEYESTWIWWWAWVEPRVERATNARRGDEGSNGGCPSRMLFGSRPRMRSFWLVVPCMHASHLRTFDNALRAFVHNFGSGGMLSGAEG